MEIRAFQSSDLPCLVDVFYRAVHETAVQDYSPEQCRVWAQKDPDLSLWEKRLSNQFCWVMWQKRQCAGFTTLDDNGYIDMMFTAPDFARQGVAQSLYAHVETAAQQKGLEELSADVSLTARPFFEKVGFVVREQQTVALRGLEFTNFKMFKKL